MYYSLFNTSTTFQPRQEDLFSIILRTLSTNTTEAQELHEPENVKKAKVLLHN